MSTRGHGASFSPGYQNVESIPNNTYYGYLSHDDSEGHDDKDSNPVTIIDGYSPTIFNVDETWKSDINSSWKNRKIPFNGLFFGKITFKHDYYYQELKFDGWHSRYGTISTLFDIWTATHTCVTFEKYWYPSDRVVNLTFSASSASELANIMSRDIQVYDYEPKTKTTLGEWHWEKTDEKTATLYVDIGYNFSRVYPKIVKISAGGINLCTVFQKKNEGNDGGFYTGRHLFYKNNNTGDEYITDSTGDPKTQNYVVSPSFKVGITFGVTKATSIELLECNKYFDYEANISPRIVNDISPLAIYYKHGTNGSLWRKVKHTDGLYEDIVEKFDDFCYIWLTFGSYLPEEYVELKQGGTRDKEKACYAECIFKDDNKNVYGVVVYAEQGGYLAGGMNPRIDRTFMLLDEADVYRKDYTNNYIVSADGDFPGFFELLGYTSGGNSVLRARIVLKTVSSVFVLPEDYVVNFHHYDGTVSTVMMKRRGGGRKILKLADNTRQEVEDVYFVDDSGVATKRPDITGIVDGCAYVEGRTEATKIVPIVNVPSRGVSYVSKNVITVPHVDSSQTLKYISSEEIYKKLSEKVFIPVTSVGYDVGIPGTTNVFVDENDNLCVDYDYEESGEVDYYGNKIKYKYNDGEVKLTQHFKVYSSRNGSRLIYKWSWTHPSEKVAEIKSSKGMETIPIKRNELTMHLDGGISVKYRYFRAKYEVFLNFSLSNNGGYAMSGNTKYTLCDFKSEKVLRTYYKTNNTSHIIDEKEITWDDFIRKVFGKEHLI